MNFEKTEIRRAVRTALLGASALVAFAANTSAQAQAESGADAKNVSSGGIDEIIVTARRVDERLQDVPISVGVYNPEDLSRRNVAIATDLGAFAPSLSANQRFGPEKASFAIRGFNQTQNTAPTVGMYFAEAVAVRAQGGTPGGNSVGAGAFTDLANVQILRGPQGTLFGRNTTGGAILLSPQKPTDQFEGFLEGTYGNYEQVRIAGAVNLPVSDTFKVRLTVERNEREGYMKNHAAQGPRDYNDLSYLYGRLSVLADLTPDLENYLVAHYSRSQTHGYASHIDTCSDGTFTGVGLLQVLSCREQAARQAARGDGLYDVENNLPDPQTDPEQWQVINTTTWRATDTLTVKNIFSYGEYRERLNLAYLSTNFTVPNVDNSGGFPLGPILIPAGRQYIQFASDGAGSGTYAAAESTMTEEIQIQGRSADDRFNYVVGGYLETSRPIGFNQLIGGNFFYCDDLENFVGCTNPLGFASHNQVRAKMSFDTYGLFGQGTAKLTDELSLTAGIRWTSDKIEGVNQSTLIALTTGPGSYIDPRTGVSMRRTCADTAAWGSGMVVQNPAECADKHTAESEEPTGELNLSYAFSPNLMTYGKYSRGYRQGGMMLTAGGSSSWGPESLDSFEVGAKTSFSRGATSGYLNAAAFYSKLTDMQVLAQLIPTPAATLAGVSPSSTVLNAAEARVYGLEIDSSLEFFDSLRISVGYTYLDTKVVDVATSEELAPSLEGTPYATANPQVASGTGFLDTPEHKLTLNATYTLPLDPALGELSVGTTWIHTSTIFTNYADPEYFQGFPVGLTPSNDLVNLNFDWMNVAGSPVSASVFVTNLTEEEVRIPSQFPFAFSGGAVHSGYMPPRMYGLRLRYDFGN